MNRQSDFYVCQVDELGPDYNAWNNQTKIMFLEKRLAIYMRQMRRQERLADNHRSLLKAIHKEHETALRELQDKNSSLKKVSSELRQVKKNLERQVRKRTRELEEKNIKLEKHARELERSNIAMDVLLHRREKENRIMAGQINEKWMAEILPDLEKLSQSAIQEEQRSILDAILKRIKADHHDYSSRDNEPLMRLSNREAMVTRLISHGRTCREAAEVLDISVRSVQSHCYNIRKKLGLPRNVSLKDFLRSNGE